MKTYLFKCIENFTTKKWKKISIKILILSYFCSKHRLWVLVRTASILTSTHNLCLWAEIWKNDVYPCKPQLYYIKVGFKGAKTIQACFRDGVQNISLESFCDYWQTFSVHPVANVHTSAATCIGLWLFLFKLSRECRDTLSVHHTLPVLLGPKKKKKKG